MPQTLTPDEQAAAELPQSYAMIDTNGAPLFTAVHAEGFALIVHGGATIQRVDQLERLAGVVQRALLEAIERDKATARAQLAADLRPRPGETPGQ